MVQAGTVISTREVFNEIQKFNDREHVLDWTKRHKQMFITPSNLEMEFVSKIFAVRHFQQLISEKSRLRGSPVADPIVIAAAALIDGGKVVCQEKFKENAAKMSNICKHFGIPCTDLEGFLAEQDWQF